MIKNQLQVESVLQKCNIFYIRTAINQMISVPDPRDSMYVVVRAEFTTFTFSESVGNGTEVLIQKLLRFFVF